MAQKPFGKVRPPLPGSQAGAAEVGAAAIAEIPNAKIEAVNFMWRTLARYIPLNITLENPSPAGRLRQDASGECHAALSAPH
jgi:hypothetical protein